MFVVLSIRHFFLTTTVVSERHLIPRYLPPSRYFHVERETETLEFYFLPLFRARSSLEIHRKDRPLLKFVSCSQRQHGMARNNGGWEGDGEKKGGSVESSILATSAPISRTRFCDPLKRRSNFLIANLINDKGKLWSRTVTPVANIFISRHQFAFSPFLPSFPSFFLSFS